MRTPCPASTATSWPASIITARPTTTSRVAVSPSARNRTCAPRVTRAGPSAVTIDRLDAVSSTSAEPSSTAMSGTCCPATAPRWKRRRAFSPTRITPPPRRARRACDAAPVRSVSPTTNAVPKTTACPAPSWPRSTVPSAKTAVATAASCRQADPSRTATEDSRSASAGAARARSVTAPSAGRR